MPIFLKSKSNRIKYQRGNSKTLFSSNRYLFMIFLKHQRFYFFFNLWICNHINKVFTFCSATYISNCTFFPIPYIRVFPDFSDRYISTCILDTFFPQIKSFLRLRLALVFGLQTYYLIDFSKIYQLKCLEPKNKG